MRWDFRRRQCWHWMWWRRRRRAHAGHDLETHFQEGTSHANGGVCLPDFRRKRQGLRRMEHSIYNGKNASCGHDAQTNSRTRTSRNGIGRATGIHGGIQAANGQHAVGHVQPDGKGMFPRSGGRVIEILIGTIDRSEEQTHLKVFVGSGVHEMHFIHANNPM